MTSSSTPSPIARLSGDRRLLVERLLRERRAAQDQVERRGVPAGETPPGLGDGPGGLAISLFFFSADLDDRAADKHAVVLECAELADRLGLHAIWVPERHFDPFGAPYPSPAVLLAAVAARTRRIGLRAGSVVLPLRDPLLVAEEWAVLDSISQGRVGLSFASGWHADDFVLNPDGYERRKEVLRERLADLRTLWQGGSVTRPGPGGRPVEVRTYPRLGRVPELWLTSSGNPETWRAAGESGLHVLTALLEQSVDDLAAKARIYREALVAAGHSPEGRQITCMLHTHLAEDPGVVLDRVRGPLTRYLAAHLNLFAKFAASQDVGVRPEDVTEADREALLEHGFRRYFGSAGLFGSVDTCQPMLDRLMAAGVTELGCLVDFGLPREQVLECVRELGKLQARLREAAGGRP